MVYYFLVDVASVFEKISNVAELVAVAAEARDKKCCHKCGKEQC